MTDRSEVLPPLSDNPQIALQQIARREVRASELGKALAILAQEVMRLDRGMEWTNEPD